MYPIQMRIFIDSLKVLRSMICTNISSTTICEINCGLMCQILVEVQSWATHWNAVLDIRLMEVKSTDINSLYANRAC